MPSFDIVSEVSSMEIENAVNQAKKELANRFDFKGSNAEILLEKNEIKLSAPDHYKVAALHEIVIGKSHLASSLTGRMKKSNRVIG